MSEERFLELFSLATRLDLGELCKCCLWFSSKHPLLGQDFDLSEFSAIELMTLLRNIANYNGLPHLLAAVTKHFKDAIELDRHFVRICHHICDTRDAYLKAIFIASIKEKPQLMEALRQNRKDAHREH
jgi:hypothetical protein